MGGEEPAPAGARGRLATDGIDDDRKAEFLRTATVVAAVPAGSGVTDSWPHFERLIRERGESAILY